jgi:hypothetical protein
MRRFLLLMMVLAGLCLSVYPAQVAARTGMVDERVRQLPTSTRPDFQAFAHRWIAHGASLVFASNGQALFEERTYIWCSAGVHRPCDRMRDNRIYPGYWETIQFTRVAGSTAFGEVRSGNLQTVGVTVRARLQAHDTLLYTSRGSLALLCGPHAPAGTCGA